MEDFLILVGATGTAVLAWVYVALVVVLGRSIGRIYIGPDVVALSLPFVVGGFYVFFRRMITRGAAATVLRVSLAVFFSVGSLFAADVLYSFHLNSPALGKPVLRGSRLFDPALTAGELLPRLYFPTNANFRVHKPNVTIHGAHYGDEYAPELLESPTLVALLKPHPLTVTIDEHGFRNTTPIDEAEIFALGDSFTFGWAVDAEDAWVGRLQDLLDRPVYNLGVHDSSPKQELELLKYMLRTQGAATHVRRLIWMIYEGNDLEDSYAEQAPGPAAAADPGTWTTLIRGTVVDGMVRLAWLVRNESIIHRILAGELTLRTPDPSDVPGDRYVIDGVESWFPLYRSRTLGARLFRPYFIEHAAKPASYLWEHPNRPRLESVFEEMARLAEEHGFEVTVVIAPTAVRLQGSEYADFPPISDEPYFIDYVAELSSRMGFQTLDLLRLLEPFAGTEPLYFSDDDHWNQRGHALAAEIIRREAFP